MLYAINNGSKILPEKHLKGHCPDCGDSVIAKCGEVNQWHWAHVVNAECKNNKPETMWHKEWKLNFPQECVEEKIKNHRADVFINGVAIEFQASTIARPDIVSRNEVFKKVFWVIKAEDKHLFFREVIKKTKFYSCKWKWRKTSFDETLSKDTRIFLDVGDDFLFLIKNKKLDALKFFYGEFITKEYFVRKSKKELRSNFFIRTMNPNELTDYGKKDIAQKTSLIKNELFEDIIKLDPIACSRKLTVFLDLDYLDWAYSTKCECVSCKNTEAMPLPKYITDKYGLTKNKLQRRFK